MKKLFAVGVVAGLMLPLVAASEARAEGFSGPEMWLDDFGVASGWRVDRHLRLMGDVDGDELDDIVGFGEQGVLVALSTGSGFTEPEMWVDNYSFSNGWRVDKHPRFLVDVNDDDLLDIVGFGNNGVYVSLSTGSRFRPPRLWVSDYTITSGWRVDRHPRFLVDINDDDLPDIVGFGDDGVFVSKSTGSKFTEPELWVDDFGYRQGWRVDRNPRLLVDVNDDDRADIVGFDDDGVLVARAANGRFTSPRRWVNDFGYRQGWRTDRHVRVLADVNDNDRADIIGFGDAGTLLALGRSDRFSRPERVLDDFGYAQGWRVDRHPRLVGDIDGDDRADIVGFGDNGVIVSTSRGASFASPYRAIDDFGYRQGWRVDEHVRVLADVNGDELLDIVGFGDDGTLVALADF